MKLIREFDVENNKDTYAWFVECYFKRSYCGYHCHYKKMNEKHLWNKMQTITNFYDCENLERGRKCPNYSEIAQSEIDKIVEDLKMIYLPKN
jgi:hypothetical protein